MISLHAHAHDLTRPAPDDAGRRLRSSRSSTRILVFAIAVLCGTVVGSLVGSLAGGAGIVAGVVLGGLLGAACGRAFEVADSIRDRRDGQLDDDIGVTSRDLGVPRVVMPKPEPLPGEAWPEDTDTWPPPPPGRPS